ncbi:hypothetical protein HDU97_005988 [Phlyctochytrium planicorne]|nr:hypothetical protein HDU97_005988 [Phlyctochytrium planicorne]
MWRAGRFEDQQKLAPRIATLGIRTGTELDRRGRLHSTSRKGRKSGGEIGASMELYLFQEGVLVAKKDFNAPKHADIDVANLYVIKALQSMESRGLVKVRFSWQYYYYYLTEKGIEYLREYLHLPAAIVPRTHIKTTKAGIRPQRSDGPRGDGAYRAPRGDGEGYRRRDAGEKKEGASGDFKPEFRGGFGRGSAPQ